MRPRRYETYGMMKAREEAAIRRDVGDLPQRVITVLRQQGIHTADEVAAMSDDELLRLRNLGYGGLRELRRVAPYYGERVAASNWVGEAEYVQ